MYAAVGIVITPLTNTPSMHPITMNPFMLVIVAVATMEFNPDIIDVTDTTGEAKNWMS